MLCGNLYRQSAFLPPIAMDSKHNTYQARIFGEYFGLFLYSNQNS